MHIKSNRSSSYVGTFVASDKGDMNKLNELRESVSLLNKTDAFGRYIDYGGLNNSTIKKRVVVRGRKAITKIVSPRGYFIPGSKGPVQYSYHGNIVGGIKNAKEFDVYIYDRSN